MYENVRVRFDDGTNQYNFPLVYHLTDPKEGMKATVIQGKRSDGTIVIPGGKKSQEIIVRGKLTGNNYNDIRTKMDTLKSNVTTDIATLSLQEKITGVWTNNWSYTVRRIEEIRFPRSLRVYSQEYECIFLVLSY